MKYVRRPLVDVNWVDLMTGVVNVKAVQENDKRFHQMMDEQKCKAEEMLATKQRNSKGEVFISWFWRVKW